MVSAKNPPKNRKLKAPAYKSFRLQKRIRSTKEKLPGVKDLCKQTITILKRNKRFFIIFTALYGVLSYVLIQSGSVNNIDLSEAKRILLGSTGNAFATSVSLFGVLVGSAATAGNQTSALYQFMIIIVFSLAIIYGLRFMYGAQASKVTVKESLYKGMTPMIPVLLVLCVIGLQLLPLSIGSGLYATVVSAGLAVTSVEKFFWILFVTLLSLLTLYLLCSSVFALYIVTLPDMTPMRSLRAARELVRHRRLEVIRKIVFLPIILLLILGIIIVPLIAWVPAAAQPIFLVASTAVLPVVHAYMYNLYRRLL